MGIGVKLHVLSTLSLAGQDNALATLTEENKPQDTLARRMGGNQAHHEKKSWNQIPDTAHR